METDHIHRFSMNSTSTRPDINDLYPDLTKPPIASFTRTNRNPFKLVDLMVLYRDRIYFLIGIGMGIEHHPARR